MTIRKRGTRYYYDFMIRRQRYRGAIPEARTKAERSKLRQRSRIKSMSASMEKSRQADRSLNSCAEHTYCGPGRISVRERTMNFTRKFSVVTSEIGA